MKLQLRGLAQRTGIVAPHTGTRIEIPESPMCSNAAFSRPHAGIRIEISAEQQGVDEKTARAVSAVAVRTNRPVLFVAPETLQTVGTTGQYNTQTNQDGSGNTQVYQAAGRYTSDGTVEISAALTTDEAVDFVLKHELTHAIEGSGTYSRLKELVRKQMGAEAYAAAVQQAEQTRSRQGDTKGAQNAESEVVADWIGENLYRDGFARMIQNLDGGMAVQFRAILDGVQRAFGLTKNARQAATIRAAERAFAEVLESDYSSTGENAAAEAGDGVQLAYMNDKSFEENIDEIVHMTDEEAVRRKSQGQYITVLEHTPDIILNNVNGAIDRKIIIRFDAAYLATRHDGALEGHYHNYGENLPALLKNVLVAPDAILRLKNGRLNLLGTIETEKGKYTVVSVEMNTVKDINSRYAPYNLVVTMMPAKDNYVRNIVQGSAVQMEYEKEDLPQVNPQLHKSLSIINGTSSDTRISQETPGVNTQSMQNSKENSYDGQKSYLPTDMQERERAAATQKAENTRRLAEQQQQQEQAETAEELRRKNEALQKKVEKLRQQTRRTTEKTVREEDVQKLTRKILKEYSSTLKSGEILEAVQALGDTIVQGGQLSYDELHREALRIAQKIVNRSETLIDDGYSATYEDIRQYLRDNKVSIREEDKSDIADYEAFRRRNQRRLNLSKDGTPVDVLYGEMQETTDEAIAYEEMVADACQTMLLDSNAVEKLIQLRQQDKGLFEKIKEFIHNILDKLRKEYAGIDPNSDEAKALRSMTDVVEQLSALFEDAAVDAAQAHSQAAAAVGLDIDTKNGSVNPASYSLRTWKNSDYVQNRDIAAQEIAEALGISVSKAKAYIDDINSVAYMISSDQSRLDYDETGLSPFVSNAEYGGSFDYTTLCTKRRLITGTFSAIQKALPNTALTAQEILDIRKRMDDAGLEVNCGKCYVEGSRANMGKFTKKFIELYRKYNPGKWYPNMAEMNTPDGVEWVRVNHPEVYEQYEYFWNHYGTLKPGDPNMFASQQKPKLYQMRSAYDGEILRYFKGDAKVEEKNRNGGIRMQSFSDFEIVHLIDAMQTITDMSRVGLNGQAYTKMADFAWALGNTGLKINLSIDAWGVDENGKLIFNNKEGMPFETAMELRNAYSENVGTICCVYDDAQLLAALADDRIDFVIPFHRSQWKKAQYKAMGLPSTTKDYTYQQNEKWINPSKHTHEYRGRQVKTKVKNYMPNEYWDFSKSGKENAEAYLAMCARDGKRPKFYKFLDRNPDGSFSLKKDGSTDGYWKLLIDFKMYDNNGVGSPQMPVRPNFNMTECMRMLNEYKGGHEHFPVAQGIVNEFVEQYRESHPADDGADIRYSFRNTKSGMANDSLKPYSAELTDIIIGNGDFIVDSFDALVDVVNLAFDEPTKKATAYFGNLDVSILEKIKSSIPDLPSEYRQEGMLFKKGMDYSVAATLDNIRHLIDEKGLSKADVIDYLDRLADTIADFDTVNFSYYIKNRGDKRPGLRFKKTFSDGTFVSFEIPSKKRTRLSMQTMFLERADYKKRKSAEPVLMQNAPAYTPEVRGGQTSENSIAHGSQDVKTSTQIKSATDNIGTFDGSNPDIRYSKRVTDKKTLEFLNGQETVTTYKAMQLIDGKLYPPMAAKVKGDDGKYHLTNPSELGVWQEAVEDPAHIKVKKNGIGYYTLNKGNGKSIDAAYNPYEHSSNLVLNDQFEEAYQRENIVTVECVIPKSELSGEYKAEFAKDSTGMLDWKSGVVAGKLKDNKRKVYLSRWLKPVRILSDAETATMYKKVIGNDISVPFNVVTPGLRAELEKLGVTIDYEGTPGYKAHHRGNDSTQSKFSKRSSNERYTYDALVSKPDMPVTELKDTVPDNRADVIYKAKRNAAKVGKFNPKDGSVSVHVDDIDADVVLSTQGLRHGLRRTNNLRSDINAFVALHAGEIVSNSIRINELTPSKADAAGSFVLIGAARSGSDLYAVRSVVNRFELTSMNVLYALKAKKRRVGCAQCAKVHDIAIAGNIATLYRLHH